MKNKDIAPRNKMGQPHGLWEIYYINGNLMHKGAYNNGRVDGLWEGYHKNGKLHYRHSFVNGIISGIHETYYDSGKCSDMRYYII